MNTNIELSLLDAEEKELLNYIWNHIPAEDRQGMTQSDVLLVLDLMDDYLVENGLTTDKYPQDGLDFDDAPADLKERFRHNGIKRHVFNTVSTGDLLTLDADNCFSIDYPAFQAGRAAGTFERLSPEKDFSFRF